MNKMKVLILKGKRGTAAKVYCPDDAVLHKVETMIREALVQSTPKDDASHSWIH